MTPSFIESNSKNSTLLMQVPKSLDIVVPGDGMVRIGNLCSPLGESKTAMILLNISEPTLA